MVSSTVEFKRQTANVFLHVLTRCNLRCRHCYINPEQHGRKRLPIERIERWLAVFADRSPGANLVLLGGEPTLHPDLPHFCARVKSLGYSVKLDTNGSRPQMLTRLIREGLVDYVAMDIKTDPERYEGCIAGRCDSSALLASMRVIMDSELDYEFRTTCVKPLVTPDTVECIARLIQGCRRYTLQPFKAAALLHPEYFSTCDPACSPDEMDHLKCVAEPWVQTCLVR